MRSILLLPFATLVLASVVLASETSEKPKGNGIFRLECETKIVAVQREFKAKTEVMLDRVFKVKRCGTQNSYMQMFNVNEYKNCIEKLRLPEAYESKFEHLNKTDFSNSIDFKKAVKAAAQSVCSDLNEQYANDHNVYNENIRVTVSGGHEEVKVEQKQVVDIVKEDYAHSNNDSSIGYLIGLGVMGTVILILFAVIIVLLRKQKQADKEKAEAATIEQPNWNPMMMVQGSASTSENSSYYDPSAPPSYHDVKI